MSQRITKEDREIIAKVCPKFNRICACYVNNPEYGVQLSSKAKRALNRAKNSDKPKENKPIASVRLDKEEMERLKRFCEEHNTTLSVEIREAIRWIYK